MKWESLPVVGSKVLGLLMVFAAGAAAGREYWKSLPIALFAAAVFFVVGPLLGRRE